MSMNLYFRAGKGYIDFPFQTPTDLSERVLKVTRPEERFYIVSEYVNYNIMVDDREAQVEILERCRELMFDPTLTLEM